MKNSKAILQRGIGLIELMISVLLASLIIVLVIQQYLVCKRLFLRIHPLLEQSFELQLIQDLLRNSVRRAGFTPCLSINSFKSFDHRSRQTKIAAIKTKEGFLQVNRMSERFTTVASLLSQNQLLLQSHLQLEPKQTILLADCYHAEIHQVLQSRKTRTGTMLTLANNLVFNYRDPVYVGEWIEETFFIQKNSKKKSSLFYQQNHPEELSDFINKMSIDLKEFSGKTFVNIILGLGKAKTIRLETGVRGG